MEDKPAYTVREVALEFGLSPEHIRRMFLIEPGVIVVDRPETRHKKRYRTLRIPRAVFERVLGRLTR